MACPTDAKRRETKKVKYLRMAKAIAKYLTNQKKHA
jgi:hypothetical protein